ncbi:uncharacterized protein LOC117895772 [Drosophila subobscura]|uniref:uncharacterized protein LOC117895772 n=1 Tax=Drosophila subobscura TaxID=7241 RepID=UPI00155A8FF1|nr:uncharacterized protein LOC117895772 [Drosophila subobscura]
MLKHPTTRRKKSLPPRAPHVPIIERPSKGRSASPLRMSHIQRQPEHQGWSNPGQNVSDDLKQRLLALQMQVSAWKAIKK